MLDVREMFDDGEVVDVHEAIQIIGASERTVRRLASQSVAFRGGNRNGNQPTLYWRHKIEKIAQVRRSHRCRICGSPTSSPSFATCGNRKCLGALRRLKKPVVRQPDAEPAIDRMSQAGIIRPITDTRMILTEWRQATQVDDVERYVFVAKRCRTNVATVYSVVKRMGA